MTRPRGKSFPRGQSAVPPRGLTILWCIYSRFSIFCLNVWCFLKFFAQLSLICHVYNNPERRKRATIVCFLKKKITRRVRRRFHEANIVVVPYKRTQQVTVLLGPTMLRVVGQQLCVRLHGALRPNLTSHNYAFLDINDQNSSCRSKN